MFNDRSGDSDYEKYGFDPNDLKNRKKVHDVKVYTKEDEDFAYEMDFFLKPQKFRHFLKEIGKDYPNLEQIAIIDSNILTELFEKEKELVYDTKEVEKNKKG